MKINTTDSILLTITFILLIYYIYLKYLELEKFNIYMTEERSKLKNCLHDSLNYPYTKCLDIINSWKWTCSSYFVTC